MNSSQEFSFHALLHPISTLAPARLQKSHPPPTYLPAAPRKTSLVVQRAGRRERGFPEHSVIEKHSASESELSSLCIRFNFCTFQSSHGIDCKFVCQWHFSQKLKVKEMEKNNYYFSYDNNPAKTMQERQEQRNKQASKQTNKQPAAPNASRSPQSPGAAIDSPEISSHISRSLRSIPCRSLRNDQYGASRTERTGVLQLCLPPKVVQQNCFYFSVDIVYSLFDLLLHLCERFSF